MAGRLALGIKILKFEEASLVAYILDLLNQFHIAGTQF